MAELINLLPHHQHGNSSARRSRDGGLPAGARNDQPDLGPSYLQSSIVSIHHSLGTLKHLAKATVVPRWLAKDGSTQHQSEDAATPEDLFQQAKLAKLEEKLSNTLSPRAKRKLEKQIWALKYDPLVEDERRASMFDIGRVRKRMERLQLALDEGNLDKMLSLLRTQVIRDLGGICNPQLYDRSGARPHSVIARYHKTVADVLDRIVATCRDDDGPVDKREIERRLDGIYDAFGSTALVCSGGGTMGMVHIGVIKALFEAKRLPQIVCGSSAGAIVCAILCTRTDVELPIVLEEFCHGDLDVFTNPDESWWLTPIRNFRSKGHMYDSENLERVMKKYLGSMTFKEAYSRSGKMLNITVSSEGAMKKSVILNYYNYPDVTIWSAVVASCALPCVFKKARLVEKDPVTKELKILDKEYRDGSIEGDIPIQELTRLLGCSYFIVAQANPHVLAYQETRRSLGTGSLINMIDKLGEAALDEYGSYLPYFGTLSDILSSVITQTYTGDITIVPKLTLEGFLKIMINPTTALIQKSTAVGEAITSEFVPMIKNHLKIELALRKACRDVKDAVHFGTKESDLRRTEQTQGRTMLRRSDSTQSMPALRTIDHKTSNTGKVLRTNGYSIDHHRLTRETEAEFTSDKSDELDPDSMTSLTPPVEPVDNESDIEPEPEPLTLQSQSAPASPRLSRRLKSAPPTRPPSPAMTSFSLLMTRVGEDDTG